MKGYVMPDKSVKIYSLSTCSHCRSAKRLMQNYNVEFDFVDVDLLTGDERSAMIKEVKEYNSRCSFPTIVVDQKVVVGYKEKEIKDALGV